MSHDESSFNDPKTQFLIKLVNMIDSAGWLLASGQDGQAMAVLAVLLARIEINNGDDKHKDLLELQRNMVYEYETFKHRIRPDESRIYYRMISEYMNETYFKGYHQRISKEDFKKLGDVDET